MFFPTVESVNTFNSLARMPANSMFMAYFAAMNSVAGAFAPYKGFAKTHAELVSLASRRAQAQLEVAAQLARCRTPQDLLNEQMRFWNLAADQYAETSRKVLEAWGAPAKSTERPYAELARIAKHVSRPRDYIELVPAQKPRTKAGPVGERAREMA